MHVSIARVVAASAVSLSVFAALTGVAMADGKPSSSRPAAEGKSDSKELPPAPDLSEAEAQAQADKARQAEIFQNLKGSAAPLTTDQIKEIIRITLEQERASQVPTTPPKAESVTLSTTLNPGTAPTLLRLANGYATALIVQDATGAPWPILTATLGDNAMFKIEKPTDAPNILILSPKKNFARTNLLLSLSEAPVPIAIALEAGIDSSFYRATLIVDQAGPSARVTTERPVPPVDDAIMRSLLDGVPPIGSRRVRIEGGENNVGYFFNGRFFLRTGLILKSPASISALRSSVMSIYELPVTAQISAQTRDGRTVILTPDQKLLVDEALGGDTDTSALDIPEGRRLYPILEAPQRN